MNHPKSQIIFNKNYWDCSFKIEKLFVIQNVKKHIFGIMVKYRKTIWKQYQIDFKSMSSKNVQNEAFLVKYI